LYTTAVVFLYRYRSIRADFSGGQITSDAGLLPLRAFDQRHGLTGGLAECVGDDRDDSRVSHPGLSLLRQRLYQIIAGYEDANDADRLRHDPAFQILADQPLGEPLGSQPTLSRWENSPSPRDLLKLQDALLDWFVKICGAQVRKRREILLDVDSTDDPTYGQQQLSFFNGGYDQHMYHPLLIFERHTGCLLAARLRAGTVSSHARIIPLLLRMPLLYEFCEFFGIQYTIGIAANSRLQEKAQRLERRLAKRYRRTGNPQRSFSSFLYRAYSWSHQRRICYKAEHTESGTNVRFLVSNLKGRSRSVFSFYNDRGECENRIEEFKNGFAADRLSCHRFRANAFRLLLHSFAYNLVNLFRLQLPLAMRSAQIETLRIQLFKMGARIRETARCIRIHLASGWPFQNLFQAVCNSS
jgi:hypothetical protein